MCGRVRTHRPYTTTDRVLIRQLDRALPIPAFLLHLEHPRDDRLTDCNFFFSEKKGTVSLPCFSFSLSFTLVSLSRSLVEFKLSKTCCIVSDAL